MFKKVIAIFCLNSFSLNVLGLDLKDLREADQVKIKNLKKEKAAKRKIDCNYRKKGSFIKYNPMNFSNEFYNISMDGGSEPFLATTMAGILVYQILTKPKMKGIICTY